MTIFVVFPEPESLNATIVSHGETIHWSEPLLRRMSKFVLPDGWVWRGEIASSVNAQGSSLLKSDRWAFPLYSSELDLLAHQPHRWKNTILR